MDVTRLPILGVDVGGTKILTGLVDQDGKVLESRQTPMDRSTMQSTLDSIRTAVAQFVVQLGPEEKFCAIGFGLVGRCDPSEGIWVRASNLPISHPVDLCAQMEALYHVPAFLDNDVFCATTAENAFGTGKTYKDFIVINVGTGLSAGIVSDGRLLRGAGNVAGEIGRTSLGLQDWSQGMLEDWCSGGGIYSRYSGTEYRNTRQIMEAAPQDPAAKKLIDEGIGALSEAAAALVTIFNPSAVVLAGSVGISPGVCQALRRNIEARTFRAALPDLKEVRPTRLPEGTVGLIGAAQNARELLMKRQSPEI